jgi:hypothetical protein
VRFAFLDEGGISQHEPIVVVVAVLVHADEKVIPLENRLEELVRKHIPESDWDDFVFSAKHIWAGTKYFSNREVWPWERRAKILDDLARTPGKIGVTIAHSSLLKADRREEVESVLAAKGRVTTHDLEVAYHAITTVSCLLRLEEMARGLFPNEIVQVIAEDNADARASIKNVVQLLRDKKKADQLGLSSSELLPLQRIRGSVQFAGKTESRPLQMADTCAFLIRRHLVRPDERSRYLFERFNGYMMEMPGSFASPQNPRWGVRFLAAWGLGRNNRSKDC